MDLKIILIYCVCSDFLQKMGLSSRGCLHMSDDEVIAFVIVSAMLLMKIFGDNFFINFLKALCTAKKRPNMPLIPFL